MSKDNRGATTWVNTWDFFLILQGKRKNEKGFRFSLFVDHMIVSIENPLKSTKVLLELRSYFRKNAKYKIKMKN